MANWTVSDELDARLKKHLGGGDVAEYVETLLMDQLNYDDDPVYRAEVDAQIKASQAEFVRGEGVDARQAMEEIAEKFGINLER